MQRNHKPRSATITTARIRIRNTVIKTFSDSDLECFHGNPQNSHVSAGGTWFVKLQTTRSPNSVKESNFLKHLLTSSDCFADSLSPSWYSSCVTPSWAIACLTSANAAFLLLSASSRAFFSASTILKNSASALLTRSSPSSSSAWSCVSSLDYKVEVTRWNV